MSARSLRLLLAAIALAAVAGTARADAEAVADTTAVASGPSPRRWQVGLQWNDSWRSRFDVFDRDDIPAGVVDEWGRGGGLFVGRLFGDRFLGQLLIAYAEHDIAGSTARVADVELLMTGAVLFGPGRTVQPFLRGGIGGGGQVFETEDGGGHVFSFGPAAIAGGGAQIRLGRRVSLELEAVATFTSFLQVNDMTEEKQWGGEDWQVRTSNWGWRVGAGWAFWF